MTRSMYVCLEWIIPPPEPDDTFTNVSAFPSDVEQGLGITESGQVVYGESDGIALTLETGIDGELQIRRLELSPTVTLERFGKEFQLDPGVPVEIFGGDEIVVDHRIRFRVYPHGVVSLDAPADPMRSVPSRSSERTRPGFRKPTPSELEMPPSPEPSENLGDTPVRKENPETGGEN